MGKMNHGKKNFDAVAWSRQSKRRISELLEEATPEEIMAYFNEGTLSERLKRKQQQQRSDLETR